MRNIVRFGRRCWWSLNFNIVDFALPRVSSVRDVLHFIFTGRLTSRFFMAFVLMCPASLVFVFLFEFSHTIWGDTWPEDHRNRRVLWDYFKCNRGWKYSRNMNPTAAAITILGVRSPPGDPWFGALTCLSHTCDRCLFRAAGATGLRRLLSPTCPQAAQTAPAGHHREAGGA